MLIYLVIRHLLSSRLPTRNPKRSRFISHWEPLRDGWVEHSLIGFRMRKLRSANRLSERIPRSQRINRMSYELSTR